MPRPAGQGRGSTSVAGGVFMISNTVPSMRPAAALLCRAEQIAVGIGDQAAKGKSAPAVVAGEADKRGGRAGVAGRSFGDLEHSADADRAAHLGCPEKIALGVGDQAA